jgi:hypothetical protein
MKKKILITGMVVLIPMSLMAGSGDLNNDGRIDVADVVELVNYLQGKASNYFDTLEADVNDDGFVDEKDIECLVNAIIPGSQKQDPVYPDPDNVPDPDIYSVVTEATCNDAIGTIKISDSPINGLATYFGTNDSGIEQFPYAGVDFNVGGNRFAEHLEKYELPHNSLVDFHESDYITGGTGNAGKIFFTVNHQGDEDFDIKKYEINLEDSKGNTSPVKLNNAQESNAQLIWSVDKKVFEESSIDKNNGLYVVDATINERDLDPSKFQIEKFINFQKLKSEIKVHIDNILNNLGESTESYRSNKLLLKNFIRELCNIHHDLLENNLASDASYISYSPQRMTFFKKEDGVAIRKGQSDINILTTAVKPLSYNTFWEYEYSKKYDGINERDFERAISRLSLDIREKWGDKSQNVGVLSLSESEKSVTLKFIDSNETFVVENCDYWDDLRQVDVVSGCLDVVNEKLAILLKTFTLDYSTDRAEERINNYLTNKSDDVIIPFNNHLFTHAVSPIILFETNNGVNRLYEGMFVNQGVMHAYLTSGTMELLVPAYKKYVALEKNGTLLQSFVLSGSTKSFDFKLTEPGDYTIIHSCVDYFGYVVTKKYTIHVVE